MIITSLVTLNVNSGGQDIVLEAKVRSLADISSYALDEAQMNGRDMGLLLERTSDGGELRYRYSWFQLGLQGWRQPQLDTDIFAADEFAPEIELQLELEGLPLPELTAGVDGVDFAPQVIFYASGETTPGFIELRQRDTGDILWTVEWDLLGRFTVMPRGELPEDELYNE